VPEVLFSGHHGRIAAWRREQAVARTRERRPDLLPPALDELVVTAATDADVGELWTLQQAAYLVEGRRHGTFDIPPLVETLDEVRASLRSGTVLVARRAGRLVGSVRGEVRPENVWYIGRLMVAPDLQGAGLGGTLMERVEAAAPAGTPTFRLVTGVLSDTNLRFYRRRGYRVVGRRSHPGVDVLDLEKSLPTG
jgi:tRNA (guanine37-N1)-methyltransferase